MRRCRQPRILRSNTYYRRSRVHSDELFSVSFRARNREARVRASIKQPRETSSIILAIRTRKIQRSVTEIQSRERGGSLLR